MKKLLALILTLVTMICSLVPTAFAVSTITFTNISDGGTVPASTAFSPKWKAVSGAVSYRYAVRNVSTNKVIVKDTVTTSPSFTISKSVMPASGQLKIWVAAYSGKKATGNMLTQSTIYVGIEEKVTLTYSGSTKNISPDANYTFSYKCNSSKAKKYEISITDMTSNAKIINSRITASTSMTVDKKYLTASHEYCISIAALNSSGKQLCAIKATIYTKKDSPIYTGYELFKGSYKDYLISSDT